MRRIILIFLVFLASKAHSQQIVGKSFMTIVDNITVTYDDAGEDYKVPKGTKFSVDGIDGENALVTFWNFTKPLNEYELLQDKISIEDYKLLMFLIKNPDVDFISKDLMEKTIEVSSKNMNIKFKELPWNDEKVSRNNLLSLLYENGEMEIQKLKNALSKKNKQNITDEDVAYKLNLPYKYIGRWANHLQFKMQLEDLNDKTIEYHSASHNFTYGVMTLPIKIRFGNGNERFFNFEENLNLGFTFGWQRQLSGRVKQSINVLGGVGISRVTFNEDNIPNTANNEETAAALMLNIGCLYQYETFQVGAFFGTDVIPGSVGKSWAFQGKPWLGIAIGVSLFSNDKDKKGQSGNQ